MLLWGDDKVTKFIGGPFNTDQIQKRFDCEINNLKEYNIQYWPMYLLETGEFVGCAGLRPYKSDITIREIGFQLLPKFWGKGFGKEAAEAIIEYAFNTLQVKVLFGGHHPSNDASRHLLQKLGFEFSHTELYPPTGLQHPSYFLHNPNSI